MEPRYSFEAASALYEESRRVPDGVLSKLGALLHAAAAGRWLDVGVGTGRAGRPLAAAGSAVVGIDLSPSMMDLLRQSPWGAQVKLVTGDFLRMPFRPASFDGAVAYHVLHLVHDPVPLLREIGRTLRPGAPLFWLSDTPGSPGSYLALKERYGELVAGKARYEKPSSRDFEFVARALRTVGARFEDVAADLAWDKRLLLSDLLMLFQAKAYSMLFHVPDDVHRTAMEALRPWAEHHLPFDEVLSFSIRVVRIDFPREVPS